MFPNTKPSFLLHLPQHSLLKPHASFRPTNLLVSTPELEILSPSERAAGCPHLLRSGSKYTHYGPQHWPASLQMALGKQLHLLPHGPLLPPSCTLKTKQSSSMLGKVEAAPVQSWSPSVLASRHNAFSPKSIDLWIRPAWVDYQCPASAEYLK